MLYTHFTSSTRQSRRAAFTHCSLDCTFTAESLLGVNYNLIINANNYPHICFRQIFISMITCRLCKCKCYFINIITSGMSCVSQIKLITLYIIIKKSSYIQDIADDNRWKKEFFFNLQCSCAGKIFKFNNSKHTQKTVFFLDNIT